MSSLLVVAKREAALKVVDPTTGRVRTAVPLSGVTGHEVAAGPGSLAFVPIYGDAAVGIPGTDGRSLDMIDLVTGLLVRTSELPEGSRPHAVRLHPAGSLYVTAEGQQCLLEIGADGTLRRTLPTGHPQSHMVVLSPDGSHAYTCNVSPGSISAINLLSPGPPRILELCDVANRITLSADGSTAYVADQGQARLAVVDVASMQLRTWLALPDVAFGTALSPDGRTLLLALRSAAKVAAVDIASGRVAPALDVPADPQCVVVHPAGHRAYVTCGESDCVAVVGIDEWKVVDRISCRGGPDGAAWSSYRNPSLRDPDAATEAAVD